MRRWLFILAVIGLFAAAISCQKTIYEPGESEHGGVFLYGMPSPTTR